MIIKTNNCQGDPTDISAKSKSLWLESALEVDAGNESFAERRTSTAVSGSDADLAEISLSSPQKLFIFITEKNISRIKVSKNKLI